MQTVKRMRTITSYNVIGLGGEFHFGGGKVPFEILTLEGLMDEGVLQLNIRIVFFELFETS